MSKDCCKECGREIGPPVDVEVEAELIFRATKKYTVKARTPGEAMKLGKEQAQTDVDDIFAEIDTCVDEGEVDRVVCEEDQFSKQIKRK